MAKVCEYCKKEKCSCGAESYGAKSNNSLFIQMAPFSLNGYIVWPCYKALMDTTDFVFYLGNEIIDTLVVMAEMWQEHVELGEDGTDFIWDLFCASQEQQGLEVVKKKNGRKTYFRLVPEVSYG